MDSFWEAVGAHNWEQPEQRIEYRLYYNPEDGTPVCYSMEDVPGTFIVVDRQTYAEMRYDIIVRNEKIIYISVPQSWKLVQTDTADYACHSSDIALVVDNDYANKTYWKAKITYESD